jgi:hypothetical protein
MCDGRLRYHLPTDDRRRVRGLLTDLDNLVDEAKQCLRAEFTSRGKSDRDIALLVEADSRRKIPLYLIEGADIELTRRIGSLSHFLVAGRAFRGKSNIVFDETYGYEEFDTTLWITFVQAGCVPLGSYRVRQRPEWAYSPRSLRNPLQSAPFVVVERLPFQWRQNIWRLGFIGFLFGVAAASALAGILSRLLQ